MSTVFLKLFQIFSKLFRSIPPFDKTILSSREMDVNNFFKLF